MRRGLPAPATRCPLTVVGGFLGAGKTTLLNRLLAGSQGRYAVLVNDFGAINVDAGLIQDHDGQTLRLTNGCVCCSLADGFLDTLMRVLAEPEPFDHIVIEASGVGDPGAIAEIALVEPGLVLRGVVVLADAERLPGLAADPRLGDTLARQIRAADLLVLNKRDLVDASGRAAARTTLAALAPGIPVVETVAAALPEAVFDLGGEGPERARRGSTRLRAEAVTHEAAFQRLLYQARRRVRSRRARACAHRHAGLAPAAEGAPRSGRQVRDASASDGRAPLEPVAAAGARTRRGRARRHRGDRSRSRPGAGRPPRRRVATPANPTRRPKPMRLTKRTLLGAGLSVLAAPLTAPILDLPKALADDAAAPLVIGTNQVPRHFNGAVQSGIATGMVSTQIFASPLRYDDQWNPQPYLAKSWTIAPDNLSVTLHLVDNAVFHDGHPLTAEDVAFSIGVIKANHPFQTMLEPVSTVETPDAHTVIIRLARPHPALLLAMSPGLMPILPKHVYGDGQDIKTHPANLKPVGSGPFKFVDYKQGESIQLERFDQFFIPGRPKTRRGSSTGSCRTRTASSSPPSGARSACCRSSPRCGTSSASPRHRPSR